MIAIPLEVAQDTRKPERAGLHFRCDGTVDPELVRQELRRHFRNRVSGLLPSFRGAAGYTHFLYVTATVEQVRVAWPIIETALDHRAEEMRASRSALQSRATGTYQDWQRRFRLAVERIEAELPPGTSVPDVAWGGHQRAAIQVPVVEPPSPEPTEGRALRAQIARYFAAGREADVVLLYETRRDEILALPLSGLLAEQLVGSYLATEQGHGQGDRRWTAQKVAHDLLPELERLRQAEGTRRLLREITPVEMPEPEGLPLSEQLAQLLAVEPAARIPMLETLLATHERATAARFALANAHESLGNLPAALAQLAAIGPETPGERIAVLRRQADLLLEAERYEEVIALLGERKLPQSLAGLRGVALARIGRYDAAHAALLASWPESGRDRASAPVVLELARSHWRRGEQAAAAGPYAALLNWRSESLGATDYLAIGLLVYCGVGFDELPGEQLADYDDRFAARAGWREFLLPEAADALQRRVEFGRLVGDPERLAGAYEDLFDCLLLQQQLEPLQRAMAALGADRRGGKLTAERQFHALEGLENVLNSLPGLAPILVAEYTTIATDEATTTLRRGRPLPSYIGDTLRALHFLDRRAADALLEWLATERQALIERDQPIPEREIEEASSLDLSRLRLALVGGHVATRREVLRHLGERHGLLTAVEIAPSSEARVDRGSVVAAIASSEHIAVITGYLGHDVSAIVRSLQEAGALTGRVHWLRCRGKSGVVRELIQILGDGIPTAGA